MKREPIARALSPEEQVLLGAIRLDRAQDARLRELLGSGVPVGRGLDWAALRQMAQGHGVSPLVYARLQALGETLLPAEERARWNTFYRANARHNLYLARRLLRVLELLTGGGVEALPFKGPVLALQAYGDLSRREFNDLDILVRPRDFRPAHELLTRAGYRPLFSTEDERQRGWVPLGWGPEGGQAPRGARPAGHLAFAEGDCTLELHWATAPGFLAPPSAAEMFWQGTQSVELLGRTVRTFSPQNTLLVLCIHGARHRWGELRWIADLAQLVERTPEGAWSPLLAQGEELGMRRILGLGLCLAEEPGGAALPGLVRARVHEDRGARRLAALIQGWFRGDMLQSPAMGLAHRLSFDLRSRERWRDRLRYLLARAQAWPPGD